MTRGYYHSKYNPAGFDATRSLWFPLATTSQVLLTPCGLVSVFLFGLVKVKMQCFCVQAYGPLFLVMEPQREPNAGALVQTPVRPLPSCKWGWCRIHHATWARLSLGSQLIIGAAARRWGSFLLPWLESWARVHPTPASPREVSRPDGSPPSPAACPHRVCSGRRGSQRASWLTSSPCRQPCLASRPYAEELGIGTV